MLIPNPFFQEEEEEEKKEGARGIRDDNFARIKNTK